LDAIQADFLWDFKTHGFCRKCLWIAHGKQI
jgi:hypothetical protein